MIEFTNPKSFGRRFISPAHVTAVTVVSFPEVGVRVDVVGGDEFTVKCESKEEADALLDGIVAKLGGSR